jgi:Protein of unknown function (DUF2971)
MAIEPALLQAYKETFLPYAARATDRVQAMGSRFVYYTTASTAMQILSGGEIWMRNTMIMNDFSEVEHGLSCVVNAYRSKAGATLKALLEQQYGGITAEIEQLFNKWIPVFRSDTYVLCLSEHPPEEDRHGRLSMWRAYGGDAGVALVVNGDVLFRPSTALAAYSSPVAYLDGDALEHELASVASAMAQNTSLLQQLGRDGTKTAIFHMLRFAAVCTKHPAFAEEREWRVVASPVLESSALLPVHIETVAGIPQKVLKIKLADHPDKGLIGLERTLLIDRVLIGPCEHSEVIRQALWQAMEQSGVSNPGQKIIDTGIPLRPNQR